MDNSVRIFDLDGKSGSHMVKVIQGCHSARVTCLRFSPDFKYLLSCDADGVILHYGQLPKRVQTDPFPYKLLYKVQDQFDEILAIDTNRTLDMYVTVSRDGTVALRCQRTSKLWYHFTLFCEPQSQKASGNRPPLRGFSKIFKRIIALRLSLHGYIVVVGQPEANKPNSRFLVYNLSGDVLLRDMPEKRQIKGIFLNASED